MAIGEKMKQFKDSVLHNPSFTVKEQFGYAGGLFGNCMGQDCIGTYSDKFNRDYMGLQKNEALGVRFEPNLALGNVSTVLSFAAPPIAGAVVDRPVVNGKGGARPVLKFAPVPFAIASLLLFVVPPAGLVFRIVYTFALTLLFNIADTFYDMALSAISIRMTTNPKDRKNFYTVAVLATSLGSALPGWLLPLIVGKMQSGEQEKWAYFVVALVFCILGVSSMYAPYFTLQEKVYVRSYEDKRERINIKAVLANRPLMILLTANVLQTIREIAYKYLPYFYDNTLGDYGMKAKVDMISGGLSYVGLLLVPILGNRVDSRNMMMLSYGYSALFYGVMSLFNIGFSVDRIRKLKWIIGILIGFSGMPNNAMSAARRIIIADSTDYMEWVTYKKFGYAVRSEGMVLASQSLVDKFRELLKANAYNGLLNAIGYQSGYTDPVTGAAVKPVQTDATLKGIYTVMTLCGFLGNLLPMIVYCFDNYTGKNRERILAELQEIRLQNASEQPQKQSVAEPSE
ncbi:MAG: MFS transporter [Clostridia bacterium]|nr:MFS transporter [Clostridia bacterium]